jgi:hypothetical protein
LPRSFWAGFENVIDGRPGFCRLFGSEVNEHSIHCHINRSALLSTVCFHSCKPLHAISFCGESHLRSIGRDAFGQCVSLKSITFPPSIETIGDHPMAKYKKLPSVTFLAEAKLNGFGVWPFDGCLSLKSARVPSSVEVIGEKCLAECRGLEVIQFEGDPKLLQIESSGFLGCSLLQSFGVPGRVESIGVGCFLGCHSSTRGEFCH